MSNGCPEVNGMKPTQKKNQTLFPHFLWTTENDINGGRLSIWVCVCVCAGLCGSNDFKSKFSVNISNIHQYQHFESMTGTILIDFYCYEYYYYLCNKAYGLVWLSRMVLLYLKRERMRVKGVLRTKPNTIVSIVIIFGINSMLVVHILLGDLNGNTVDYLPKLTLYWTRCLSCAVAAGVAVVVADATGTIHILRLYFLSRFSLLIAHFDH